MRGAVMVRWHRWLLNIVNKPNIVIMVVIAVVISLFNGIS